MTPRLAAVKIRGMATRLRVALLAAEKDNLKTGVQIARIWSSGTYTPSQLAAMGHPYRRGGPGLGDPALINRRPGRRGGLFLRSWQPQGPNWVGGNLQSSLVNTAPYAKYLDEGTARMIRRPIREKILAFLAPSRLARLKRAIESALTE